jgi:hypothetical protein
MRTCRSWYFLFFQGRWLPEAFMRNGDFKFMEDCFSRPPSGTLREGAISPEVPTSATTLLEQHLPSHQQTYCEHATT